MFWLKLNLILITLAISMRASIAYSQSLAEQWNKSLQGARLILSTTTPEKANQSTFSVMTLCRKGKYYFHQEIHKGAPGATIIERRERVTGKWWIEQKEERTFFLCKVPNGKLKKFPIYLQNNGKMNIGGKAYTILRGAAGC